MDDLRQPQANPVPLHALGLLSYLSILFLVPLAMSPKRSFERFHAEQGATLFGVWALGMAVASAFPRSLSWAVFDFVHIVTAVLMVVGTRNVILGVREGLPFIERIAAAIEARLEGRPSAPPAPPGPEDGGHASG